MSDLRKRTAILIEIPLLNACAATIATGQFVRPAENSVERDRPGHLVVRRAHPSMQRGQLLGRGLGVLRVPLTANEVHTANLAPRRPPASARRGFLDPPLRQSMPLGAA